MLDWLTSTIASLAAWMADHPAAIAWSLAWVAALAAAQTAKALIFPPTWPNDRAKRMAQIVAIASGSSVAYTMWPNSVHRIVFALIVGMSAPTAYTFFKAIIEARFPDLADALSWQGVKDRKSDRGDDK